MLTLKDKKFFLLDMDGTIYLDNDLFDGTLDWINVNKVDTKKQSLERHNSTKLART